MSQDSPHYRGLWWFCWPRIALWPSVKMLFYSMAPLKLGLSFSRTFNWVQVKIHTHPKKQIMIQLRGTAIAVTVRGTQQNNQTQAAHAEYKVRFQPITDANVLRLHVATDVETNQIDFLVCSNIHVSPITFIAWFNKLIAKDRSVLQSKDKRYVYLKAQATGRMRPHARRHCADVLVTGSLVHDRLEALRGVERYLEPNSLLVTKGYFNQWHPRFELVNRPDGSSSTARGHFLKKHFLGWKQLRYHILCRKYKCGQCRPLWCVLAQLL